MAVAKLAERQLLLMKVENLNKRVRAYYAQTQDVDSLIEYGVAILVRNFFCMRAFPDLIMDLIREVYFSAEATAVMRHYLPYFKDYFSKNEWQTVIKRLFGEHSNYLAQTEEARLYTSYLEQHGTLDNRIANLVYRVEAIFEDTLGKKHKLTIRETDPTLTEEQTINALKILTTLSIFDTDGVRKFATYVSYKTPGTTLATAHNSRQKEKADASEQKMVAAAQAPQQEKLHDQSDSSEAAEQKAEVLKDKEPTSSTATPSKKDAPPKNSKTAKSAKKKTAAGSKFFEKTQELIAKGWSEKQIRRELDKLAGKKKKRKKKRR